MPDPLDPTDAFFSAFNGSFLLFGAVLAVSLGGHVLGGQIHELAICLAAFSSSGWSAFSGFFDLDPLELVLSWFGVLMGSFATAWCWPFIGLDVWLLARLRAGSELFPILLAMALVQPVHTFVVMQRCAPLVGTELSIGCGLLVLSLITTASLMLWWRHTSDAAPDPAPDAEPEL